MRADAFPDKVRIVLLPIKHNDRRKDANRIQGMCFEDYQDFVKKSKTKKSIIMDHDNFMEDCNDEKIELNAFWVTYVYIKDTRL